MTELYVKENPFIDYIRRRIRRNKNCLMIIVGATGAGKSYAGLRIAEELDPNFNISRVAFRGEKFIELADQKLKAGSVIILDEAGVSLDNRTWWAQHNRMINWLLQTFRHQRLIAILTVPQLNFIDKKSLALFHVVLEVTGIDDHKRCAIVKPKMVVPRPASLTDTTFFMMYPTIKDKREEIIKVNRLHVHLPSKELRKLYEIEKNKFTTELKRDSLIALSGGKIDPRSKAIEASKGQREVLVLIKKYPDLKDKELAEMIGITANHVRVIKSQLRDKKLLMN